MCTGLKTYFAFKNRCKFSRLHVQNQFVIVIQILNSDFVYITVPGNFNNSLNFYVKPFIMKLEVKETKLMYLPLIA